MGTIEKGNSFFNIKPSFMNTKTLLGALIAGVISFLLGWLIFGILLMDYYSAHMVQYTGLTKNPPEIWIIAISNLVWGLLIAWIFSIAGINTVSKGFSTGFIIALLMVLGFDLLMYAQMNLFDIRMLGVDVVLNAVMGGITGAVLGWWFGRAKVK
jgi:hypothetical protein